MFDDTQEGEDHNELEDEVIRDVWSAEKLKLKSSMWPAFSDKLLEDIVTDVKTRVGEIRTKRIKSNLSKREYTGMMWCKKQVKERALYISRVDKGGSIMILNARDVEQLIETNLSDTNKFSPLPKNPSDQIRTTIISKVQEFIGNETLSQKELHAICGLTEKGGYSHNAAFQVRAPYCYPLFKIHKLDEQKIADKVIPPVRLVTAGTDGPTYRLGVFLENILNPVAARYCDGELVRDTSEFVKFIDDLNIEDIPSNVASLDVDALYPSIRRDLLALALEDALRTCSELGEEEIQAVLDLTKICLENSTIHYRGKWFLSLDGVPTGGNESKNLANIFVRWMIDKVLFKIPEILELYKGEDRKRFLDDIFIKWFGTEEEFNSFLTVFNNYGKEYGFTLKGECGKSIPFLDVTVSIIEGGYKTSLYTKPTDAKRYLHRRSYHSHHTFKATPYSQFRRAALICSDELDRVKAIDYMKVKFINSGYKLEELLPSMRRALDLKRSSLLIRKEELEVRNERCLTFVINQNPTVRSEITAIIKSREDDISQLLGGKTRIVFAEKSHSSTAGLLFAKSSFSELNIEVSTDQKCRIRNCKCCRLMMDKQDDLKKITTMSNINIRLDLSLNCKSSNIIYIFICKHCKNNADFKEYYIGRSMDRLNVRTNNHRFHFKTKNMEYKNSALANHVFEKHFEHFDQKLDNFDLGIIRSARARNLERCEDYYIWETRADIVGLNRNKPVK